MPYDTALVGHQTPRQTQTPSAGDVRAWVDAIGDTNPIFHDPAAAQHAGYAETPLPPTFVARARIDFAEIGLDPARSQLLHAEQEYTYARPLYAGETLSAWQQVASARQSGRGAMTILTLEQVIEAPEGERAVTGHATLIVRDQPPTAGAGDAPRATKTPAEPAGERIPALEKQVTQAQINAYAEVSGDHNPIHLDPVAARAVGLDGTIAHGMLSMAFLGQLLTDWLTASQARGGWVARLRVRFQAMVRPGDTLTCQGALGERTSDRQPVELWITNQRGERVITGDAELAQTAPAD